MVNMFGIVLGGGIGAVLRYLITNTFSNFAPQNKHIGTFLVNVLGSFLLGYIYTTSCTHCSFLYKTIVIGTIASFTTFSSYEFDNLTLIAGQRYREYFKYAFGSCLVSFLFLYIGIILAKGM